MIDTTPATDLTVADRCDRCNAQAYVRVVLLRSGLEILFCAHDYDRNAAALAEVAAVVTDARERLFYL